LTALAAFPARSLHDALPICLHLDLDHLGRALADRPGKISRIAHDVGSFAVHFRAWPRHDMDKPFHARGPVAGDGAEIGELAHLRSEEHTSELQSRENLVCRL